MYGLEYRCTFLANVQKKLIEEPHRHTIMVEMQLHRRKAEPTKFYAKEEYDVQVPYLPANRSAEKRPAGSPESRLSTRRL